VLVLVVVIIVLLIAFYLCTAFGELREVAVITMMYWSRKFRQETDEWHVRVVDLSLATYRKHSMSPLFFLKKKLPDLF
jgi:hypothetical protein